MFSFSNIEEYHSNLLQKKISCVDAINFYLKNIDKNKHLNAFVEVYNEEAIQKAVLLDEQRAQGNPIKKLHGVIVAIKDVICYKDHKVTAASKILENFKSLYTATALQLLIDEDAIIIGNCNCDEFAMGSTNENSTYGKVLNYLDETKVPGGSSGGSAVAVQADLCMVSLGSDTGGSVRQPADFCGIVGLKPGYGTISRYGLIAYASSFDQIGIFGKNIEDVKLLLQIMSAYDPMDSTMNVAKLKKAETKTVFKLAYFKQAINHKGLDPEIALKIKSFISSAKKVGHEVTEINFDLLDYVVPAYYVLTTAEASSNLSRYDGIKYGHQNLNNLESLNDFYLNNRSKTFGIEVKRRIMLGTFVLSAGYYDAYFSKAQQIRSLLVKAVSQIFSSFDAIIMPVSPCTAYKIGKNDKDSVAMYLADIYTVFANLTGIPAIAIPLFSHSNNMPFGIQILCNKQQELLLLNISETLSQLNEQEKV